MAKVWKIRGNDSSTEILEAEMPGNISEAEISATLQRLVCTHLTPEEVIRASLPKDDPGHTALLEPIGRPSELHYGENPYFTARLLDK